MSGHYGFAHLVNDLAGEAMNTLPESVVREKLRQVARFEALSAEDLQDMIREYFSAESNIEELLVTYRPSVLKLTGLDALAASSELLEHTRQLDGSVSAESR